MENELYKRKRLKVAEQSVDLFNAGADAFARDDFAGAESLFARVLEESPNDGETLYALGLSLFNRGEYANAVTYFRKAKRVPFPNPELDYMLSECFYKLKDVASAKRLIKKLLTDNDVPHLLRRLGQAYQATKKPREAITYYDASLRLDPDCKDIYIDISICMSELGLHDESIHICRRSTRRWPQDKELKVNLAISLREAGRLTDARSVLEKLLHVEMPDAEILVELANIYDELKQYESALEVAKSAISLDPENPEALLTIGIVYDHMGDYSSGAVALRKACQIEPDNSNLHYNLGVALKGLGDFEGAKSEYESAFIIDPHNVGAREKHEELTRGAY